MTRINKITTLTMDSDSQVSALEAVIFELDLDSMGRDQLIRLNSMARYMLTQSDALLAERNGGLNL